MESGFRCGRTPLDVFPGCVVEVEVCDARRNRGISGGRAVLPAVAAGDVSDARLKAVHMQIPSEEWAAFVRDLRTAIREVAGTFGCARSPCSLRRDFSYESPQGTSMKGLIVVSIN